MNSIEVITNIIIAVSAIIVGGLVGVLISHKTKSRSLASYEKEAAEAIQKSEEEVKKINNDAKVQVEEMKKNYAENELRRKDQLQRIEQLLTSKDEQLQKKQERIKLLEQSFAEKQKDVETLKQKNIEHQKEIFAMLCKSGGWTMEQAKEHILTTYAQDLERMREERLHRYENYLEEEKVRIAKNMVTGAIQRYSSPTSVEKKSLVISVPRDEHKARIIGQNAANLILLEELTGCDIIFNDAPNSIIISCIDLVKKTIAREAILRLLKEREVNEPKIRQTVEQVTKDMEKNLIKIGKDTVKQLGLDSRELPNDFYYIVGRLQFRTSYGQNILKHSFEVGYFTLMLGAELGADIQTCKVAGFFHDLGKAIDHEVGEPHDHLTRKIMEKYDFPVGEIHAAWAHHDAVPQETPEAMLVKAGDAISAGRPGARQETLEKYIERIRAIEEIANSYEGIHKTYAISAGRELRVIVQPQVLEDEHLPELATSIAQEIQENVAYPGKIKVNVIRRTWANEYTKVKTPPQNE